MKRWYVTVRKCLVSSMVSSLWTCLWTCLGVKSLIRTTKNPGNFLECVQQSQLSKGKISRLTAKSTNSISESDSDEQSVSARATPYVRRASYVFCMHLWLIQEISVNPLSYFYPFFLLTCYSVLDIFIGVYSAFCNRILWQLGPCVKLWHYEPPTPMSVYT